jgi:hypothetical protein
VYRRLLFEIANSRRHTLTNERRKKRAIQTMGVNQKVSKQRYVATAVKTVVSMVVLAALIAVKFDSSEVR